MRYLQRCCMNQVPNNQKVADLIEGVAGCVTVCGNGPNFAQKRIARSKCVQTRVINLNYLFRQCVILESIQFFVRTIDLRIREHGLPFRY